MIVIIDLSKETTPSKYAKRKGVTVAAVTNWIARDQIKYRHIEELGLTLVEIDSEEEKIKERRRRIIESFLREEENGLLDIEKGEGGSK
ncbi:hypothetical protein TH61_16300 [Rufibacter sp. DG15C]|uniref:hypothetical protein n=1 Tax=Rufibacter sp. DG15C TaxID=1379909 RepID=UPI00078BDD99|nr:hypothetical protein [Rufibacter sp. DG15C]AMM52438.1 hypothetical protein TH61_16300 [Rufibacter sp. DG15C]